MLDPNAIARRGNGDIPSTKQGLKILGCPVGHPDFVQDQLSKLSDRHDALLERIAMVEDLQSSAGFVIPSWDDLIRKDQIKAQLRKRTHPSHVLNDKKNAAVVVHKVFLEKNCALSWTSWRKPFCALRVAVHSIIVVTTGLRVRGRESWATVAIRWRP